MNFCGYVRHVTIFRWMLTTVCCSLVGIWSGLGLWLYLVSGWVVVMHTHLYYFPFPASLSPDVCQTPSKTQMDTETRPFFRLSVCPLCLPGASILWVDEARCFIEILGEVIKIRDQPIKYMKFGPLKLLPPDVTLWG